MRARFGLVSRPFGLVAGPNGNSVSAISGRTNKVTATIPVGRGSFEVAANPNTNTIYVTNQLDSTVSVLTACTK